MRKLTALALALTWAAMTAAAAANAASILPLDDDEEDLVPTGKGWGERPAPKPDKDSSGAKGKAGAGGKARTTGMSYHGGPVMLGTTNVYYIWYGNWSGNPAMTILTDLANNIGGSPYYGINTTYYNGSNLHISNSVAYAKATSTSAYKGTSLSDSAIQAVVSEAINSNALPKDANGVYFVLTSKDVTASSGFCTQYCGWHTYASIAGTNIKYSFVGNPERCPSACAAQTTSPNGNTGADAMASIIAHELEEAVTDPQLNAWYDRQGAENADKCAWTFGTTSTDSSGAKYNVAIGSRNFLIQQNWVNSGAGYCAMK